MKNKKIVTVVGARPQFIKAAALSKAIASQNEIKEVIIHTGQHFDNNMSEVFFKEMQIPAPNYKLSVNGLNHGAMTGRMIEEIEKLILIEKPDCLLVYGDTNSTLAGALAAKKLNIKVAHVEAGLRSFNMSMPEEVNRILTDRISDFLFCPTDTAVNNLNKEGFQNFNCIIENSGDIMYDSMLLFSQFADEKSSMMNQINGDNFLLCTIHRAENTDNDTKLFQIFEALNILADYHTIILPLHPRTKQKMGNIKIHPKIKLMEPLGYFDMLYLLNQCKMVITDSGGLQKEAFFNQKFCITLREETEWIELVENNKNILCGTDKVKIQAAYHEFANKNFKLDKQFYGKGDTSHKILNTLKSYL